MRKFQKRIEQRVSEAAKILNIGHLLKRKPRALSGGERQRVAVGRAIVRNPKVFLFDEPLSNLDAKLRVQMRAELSQIQKKLQTTVFYVTHDQVEAMTLGQRIGVMKDGKLHQVSDAMTLYDKPVNKFVAGFIGSPPMNFIEGIIKNEPKIMFEGNGLSFPLATEVSQRLEPYINQNVIMGIRPEDILLNDEGRNLPKFSASVVMTEPMGNETIAYLKIANNRLVVRIPSRYQPSSNENIDFYIDSGKIHFFDKTTEQTI